MSAHAAADGHSDAHGDASGHGTLRGYLTGFILAVILTAIPFWLVMSGVFADPRVTVFAVMGFAAVQVVVHMVFFLHMNRRAEGGWTMLALIFTLLLVAITLTGSLWVMFHLNANMMPMPAQDMRDMP